MSSGALQRSFQRSICLRMCQRWCYWRWFVSSYDSVLLCLEPSNQRAQIEIVVYYCSYDFTNTQRDAYEFNFVPDRTQMKNIFYLLQSMNDLRSSKSLYYSIDRWYKIIFLKHLHSFPDPFIFSCLIHVTTLVNIIITL